MNNLEIYDKSSSELSSEEYSHEEDNKVLMDAAASKQASGGNSPMKAGAGTSAVAKIKPKPSENPDDVGPVAAAVDAAGKDKIPETAPPVVQEPPLTLAELNWYPSNNSDLISQMEEEHSDATASIAKIDTDLEILDKLMAQNQDELDRLLILRSVMMELLERLNNLP